jgi:branched-chain amino acid transport system ATP-binding protein
MGEAAYSPFWCAFATNGAEGCAMAEVLLAIESLSKSFGSVRATDGVTIAIERGEMHALIGPNGAGKTTLIHQLSGLLSSDGGGIVLDGEDITHLDMARRVKKGLARSFQITSILWGYTALENVALAVQARSGSSFRFFSPVVDERLLNSEAMEALARVGLEDRASIRAGSLSHGEKRQLELAIAIATAPRLLLLDEPLAGLGQEESKLVIALLRKLKSNFTIVLVEHDMEAVFALADRISVLIYGRVIATGTPSQIGANPAVRAAYLGTGEHV